MPEREQEKSHWACGCVTECCSGGIPPGELITSIWLEMTPRRPPQEDEVYSWFNGLIMGVEEGNDVNHRKADMRWHYIPSVHVPQLEEPFRDRPKAFPIREISWRVRLLKGSAAMDGLHPTESVFGRWQARRVQWALVSSSGEGREAKQGSAAMVVDVTSSSCVKAAGITIIRHATPLQEGVPCHLFRLPPSHLSHRPLCRRVIAGGAATESDRRAANQPMFERGGVTTAAAGDGMRMLPCYLEGRAVQLMSSPRSRSRGLERDGVTDRGRVGGRA
ncbi:hypothetical protein BDN71DRAFT_1435507 [Pleurotus eryngii]|uniref:Uncharacterized protein n=1 Tax=Pleurotus eryngii TaxID=5323 RepID=A0A9P6DB21_PLEER|nr:hypothetical protein BDN71DRAFT_1435507 [Pleurotus eryngii]